MPASPALNGPTTTISSTTPSWIAWNQQQVLAAGGGGTIIVSNDSAVTWTSWNGEYTAARGGTGNAGTTVSLTCGNTTSAATTWVAWNEQHEVLVGTGGTSITSGVTGTGDTWIVWNGAYAGGNAVPNPQISNEEYQARQQRLAEERRLSEERYRASQLERQAANQRAAIILQENLTDEQKAELADKQYFTMRSIRPDGEERIYRIHRGRSHNIERVDASGRRIQRYCMHPIIDCPVEDTMLTQKFWLQNPDLEDELLRRANRS